MPWTYSSREPSSGAIVACFLIKDLVDVGSGSNDCGRVVGQPGSYPQDVEGASIAAAKPFMRPQPQRIAIGPEPIH